MKFILQTAEETIAELKKIGFPTDTAASAIGPDLTEDMVTAAEGHLGVRLPTAYLQILRIQNGGYLHEEVEFDDVDGTLRSIEGVGFDRGLDGPHGALFMREAWGYPEDVVYFDGDAHTGFCLDYRQCGSQGEPSIVWIAIDDEPALEIQVASDFGSLLRIVENFVSTRE